MNDSLGSIDSFDSLDSLDRLIVLIALLLVCTSWSQARFTQLTSAMFGIKRKTLEFDWTIL